MSNARGKGHTTRNLQCRGRGEDPGAAELRRLELRKNLVYPFYREEGLNAMT